MSCTGGQYSLWRAALGLSLAVVLLCTAPAGSWWVDQPDELGVPNVFDLAASLAFARAVLFAGALLAVLLALGLFDRAAAFGLAYLLVALAECDPRSGAVLLLPHLVVPLTVPAAPFGSWSARGRTDPRGGWRLPKIRGAVLILALAGWACLMLAAGPFVLPAVLALLFAIGPGWIPPRDRGAKETLYYDGDCALCHGAVRFLLAEDRFESFRFAPNTALEAEDVPDSPGSIVIRRADGTLLVRSAAVLHALARIGGGWRAIAGLLRLVPGTLRDRVYDFVARIRYRVFGKTEQACPVLPPDLRARFDLNE